MVKNFGVSLDRPDFCSLKGRPAPFVQIKEVFARNPKVTRDPRGAPGYFRYEGAGLEVIYNPTTGQTGHVHPVRKR